MKIEQYIEIAKTKQDIEGVSLEKSETLERRNTTMPEGYIEAVQWFFSDGTVIRFDNTTDTEPGWKGHDRHWRFEIIGHKVSDDSNVGLLSKRGNA